MNIESPSGERKTAPKSRLAEEISTGQLLLTATGLVRYNFAFAIGERAVGLWGVRSFGVGKIRLARAWSRATVTPDPFLGLSTPCAGRQFWRVRPETLLFLVEFDQSSRRTVDRVAFRAGKVRTYDGSIDAVHPDLKFEFLDLEDVEIRG